MSNANTILESKLYDPVLINTIGHSAGVLLFGFIIALLLRDRGSRGIARTRLSVLAASLALTWNVGSLAALGMGSPGSIQMQFVMALNFAVLSLLPAVLLQVVVQGKSRMIVSLGYLLSVTAVALHIAELFVSSPLPHQVALLLVAFGFALLTLAAAFVGHRTPAGRAEWFSLGWLLLFAASFLHFGYQHSQSPWEAEITWHHIGIPVALVVLLQDYRFLLLDTFVRFLMNSVLAAAYVALMLFVNQKFGLMQVIASSMFLTGLALVTFCLSLILFAHIRNLLQEWIGPALFHRKNLEERIQAISKLPAKSRSKDELIEAAAREVAAHLSSDRYAVVAELFEDEGAEQRALPPSLLLNRDLPADRLWAAAQVQLRFSTGEVRFLLTGARRGRQRYLSEDLADMQRLASVIVEQVERFRSEELQHLATQAELRALQAQINPHFLFNAFNTLYGTIDRGAVEARRLVLNLTDIFRYFLQGDRSVIPLSEELRIIRAYLEIEALRLGDRLETEIDVSESALAVMIPILSVQPLVENAVKHGVATKVAPGRVVVRAHVKDDLLQVTVEDQCCGGQGAATPHEGYGVGVANVRRRLNLSYGPSSSLDVAIGEQGSVVTLVIPAAVPASVLA